MKMPGSPSSRRIAIFRALKLGDIGAYMGLKSPSPLFIYPKDWINKMKDMNEGNDRSRALSLAQ